MQPVETKRLVLRQFETNDWPDVLELAIDWQLAPGPAFDKLPTSEREVQQLTDYLAQNERYFAPVLRATGKVIGLLALNGLDENEQFDLGHIIHSSYQDNEVDREAIAAIVDYLFQEKGVSTIVTHNADHAPQLAPLRSLGFQPGNLETGELVLTREGWEKGRRSSTNNHFPPLETTRLLLRPICAEDSSFVIQHFLNPDVQRYLYDEEPMTMPEQALAIIDFYTASADAAYNRWVIVRKVDQQPMGTCGFHKWSRPHRRAEIGYDLSPDYQGHGYMTEAVAAMIEHGFQRLNLYRIEALVAVENERSLALLHRLGFQQEGILRGYFWSSGQAYDHVTLSRLRSDISTETT